MSRSRPITRKKNGRLQRSDVGLTKETAMTLVQMILQGESLFSDKMLKRGYIIMPDGSKLLTTTLSKWVARGNVVPETGEPLRELFERARQEYRARKREERQEQMLDQAEKKLNRTVSMRTTFPLRDKQGKMMRDESGNVIRVENARALQVQAETAKYLTERLDSDRYGQKTKTENKHMVFSLSDLRNAKEQGNEQNV